MNENVDKVLTEFVSKSLESKGEASLRVRKFGLFERPDEAADRYRKLFKGKILNVIIDCYEDTDDPKNFFLLFIHKIDNQ